MPIPTCPARASCPIRAGLPALATALIVACSSSQKPASTQPTEAELMGVSPGPAAAAMPSATAPPKTPPQTKGDRIDEEDAMGPIPNDDLRPRAAPVHPGQTPPPNPEVAIGRAAHVACDLENKCGRVGPDRMYPTTVACLAAMRDRFDQSAVATSCPDTIEPDRLDACLAAIRGLRCMAASAPFTRPTQCSRTELCTRQRPR